VNKAAEYAQQLQEGEDYKRKILAVQWTDQVPENTWSWANWSKWETPKVVMVITDPQRVMYLCKAYTWKTDEFVQALGGTCWEICPIAAIKEYKDYYFITDNCDDCGLCVKPYPNRSVTKTISRGHKIEARAKKP